MKVKNKGTINNIIVDKTILSTMLYLFKNNVLKSMAFWVLSLFFLFFSLTPYIMGLVMMADVDYVSDYINIIGSLSINASLITSFCFVALTNFIIMNNLKSTSIGERVFSSKYTKGQVLSSIYIIDLITSIVIFLSLYILTAIIAIPSMTQFNNWPQLLFKNWYLVIPFSILSIIFLDAFLLFFSSLRIKYVIQVAILFLFLTINTLIGFNSAMPILYNDLANNVYWTSIIISIIFPPILQTGILSFLSIDLVDYIVGYNMPWWIYFIDVLYLLILTPILFFQSIKIFKIN